MVVGAYTIINTIGLLAGLPITINQSNNELTFDINNNFSYVLNDDNSLSDEYFVICEFNDNLSSLAGKLNVDCTIDVFYNLKSYRFEYSQIIDNKYLLYSYDNNSTTTTNNNSLFIDFTTVDLGSNSYSLKQLYVATYSNSFSPINGDSIISSITSGLGLMGDITTNFKNGFSALFWNSTDNKLTTFGNFALIFLGVSITFAIIKLCLNLIRSKTGV